MYVEVLRVHVNAPTGKQTVAWATKLQLITGILFINDIMHSLLGLSLLALQATCGSAEPSPNKSQVAEKRVPKFILRCEERIPGAEYKAWYQECMDKMANKSGLTLSAETGDYEHGWGCKCSYTSSSPLSWAIVRQHVWDEVISKDPSCSNAMYCNSEINREIGLGITYMHFWCV